MKKLLSFLGAAIFAVSSALGQVVIPAGTSLNITSVAATPSGGTPAYGPGSSTNNAWALWDGTGGNLLKNSDVTYSTPTLSAPAAFAISGASTILLKPSGGTTTTFATGNTTTTVPIYAAVGAAATPGLVFTGDVDTGFYWTNNDRVEFASGGIGYLTFTGDGTNGAIRNRTSLAGMVYGNAGELRFTINSGTEKMRLAATTGNLLVGGLTTDPSLGPIAIPVASAVNNGIAFGTNTTLSQTAAGSLTLNYVGGTSTILYFGENGVQKSFIQSTGGSFYSFAPASGENAMYSGGARAFTADSSQNATFAGNVLRFATTKGVQGTNTNDNVAAGYAGEYSSSLVASGSAVSLTTNTAANVTNLSLTAGDWEVEGMVSYTLTGATTTAYSAGTTSTSATVPTDGSEGYSAVVTTALTDTETITLGRKRFSLSGTTTVYLVGKCTFTLGTVAAFGNLTARRIR